MFRILGFVVGSVVSIAALVMLVGMPNFHLSDELDDEARYGAAIRQLKEKQQALADVAEPAPVAGAAERHPPATRSAEETIDAGAREPTSESIENTTNDTMPVSPSAPQQAAATPVPESPVDDAEISDPQSDDPPLQYAGDTRSTDPEWYAFWNPFRSEIAARGFVRRLENITGLDYRVVKVKNGVYQVAFSYNSDVERSSKLSQISAATGLELSDRVP